MNDPKDCSMPDFGFKAKQSRDLHAGSVSDLLVFISGLIRYNEVKSLKVRPRILGVIKISFL